MKKATTAKYFAIIAIVGVFIYLTITQSTAESREFNFKYNVELEKTDDKVEVWIPVPQSNEVQEISNLTLTGNDAMDCERLKEEKHGNMYYYCTSQGLDSTTVLTLSVDVIRQEHQTVDYKNVNSDNYGLGTKNRTVFEGAVFDQIIKEANLTKDNVRGIYNYVLTGMHYGKPTDVTTDKNYKYYDGINSNTDKPWLPNNIDYGRKKISKDEVVDIYHEAKKNKTNYTYGNGNSQYACDIGVGNCTDYHSYFMSLCRTLDIPARFHMGFSIPNKDDEKEGSVGGYHCWADYYTEGKGWTPVDISEADKNPDNEDYFFGTVNQHRVEFVVGRDLQLKNRDTEENFFVYPIVEGTSYNKSFSYKNL